jgi:hypothetical protein
VQRYCLRAYLPRITLLPSTVFLMICKILPGGGGGGIKVLGNGGGGGTFINDGGGGGGGIFPNDGRKGGGGGMFPDSSAVEIDSPKISGCCLLKLFAVSVSTYFIKEVRHRFFY